MGNGTWVAATLTNKYIFKGKWHLGYCHPD